MRTIAILLLAFTMPPVSEGQNLDSLFGTIERNNPRLQAVQKWVETGQVRSRTGIYPEGPEITYNYLWGNRSSPGDQQELEVIQPFRYPGYYTSLSEVQRLEAGQLALMALEVRREVRCDIRTAWINLAFFSRKQTLLEEIKDQSDRLIQSTEQGVGQGEISRPAYDRLRILHIRIISDLQSARTGTVTWEERLKQLNGGTLPGNGIYDYPEARALIPLDSLPSWLETNHPEILRKRMEIDEQTMRLRHEKLRQLPAFEAGYKYETILNEQLQGIHAGISVPLWENSRKVRQARLEQEVARATYDQVKGEVVAEVTSLYHMVVSLETIYQESRDILSSVLLPESSRILLATGQISFPEYLVEFQFMMDSRLQFLENERDYYSKLYEFLVKTGTPPRFPSSEE